MNEYCAVFIDRDGTIIEDVHYAREPEKIYLLPNAAEGLRVMASKGYLIFVVSNQSGVGRGLIQDHEFNAVHEKVCELLRSASVEITEFIYCFHHPEDQCNCRKPKTGLIPKSFQEKPINFKKSFAIGDSDCDLKLGDNLGSKAFLVLTGKGKETQRVLSERGELDRYTVSADLAEIARALPKI
jgi:D-glycero-D-manno-heptose 1,7-bisphosphate phosphatase